MDEGQGRERGAGCRGTGAGSGVPDGRRAGASLEGCEPDHRQGRFRQLHRSLGLWQDHLPALHRGAGASHRGQPDRERHDTGRGASQARLWLCVSGGGALPLAHHRGQYPPAAGDHGVCAG
ncbi:UNVERIFIED_CONTAM: hypothetical protein NCL1_00053 [Trichonephila clavipes]